MWLIGPVVLALVIWLVSLIRDTTGPTTAIPNPAGLRRILDDRLARGEIDRDEYQARLAILERR